MIPDIRPRPLPGSRIYSKGETLFPEPEITQQAGVELFTKNEFWSCNIFFFNALVQNSFQGNHFYQHHGSPTFSENCPGREWESFLVWHLKTTPFLCHCFWSSQLIFLTWTLRATSLGFPPCRDPSKARKRSWIVNDTSGSLFFFWTKKWTRFVLFIRGLEVSPS